MVILRENDSVACTSITPESINDCRTAMCVVATKLGTTSLRPLDPFEHEAVRRVESSSIRIG